MRSPDLVGWVKRSETQQPKLSLIRRIFRQGDQALGEIGVKRSLLL
ncbi:MAG: hypothetical protein ACFCU5_07130 [Pleurocapsa sp.]